MNTKLYKSLTSYGKLFLKFMAMLAMSFLGASTSKSKTSVLGNVEDIISNTEEVTGENTLGVDYSKMSPTEEFATRELNRKTFGCE